MRWFWGTWLFLVLFAQAAAAEADLHEVKVWYYGRRMPPVLVKWWTAEGLKVDREFIYPAGQGRFRVRAITVGSGADWVSIAFRDRSLSVYELPLGRQRVRSRVKDVYFSPPAEITPGSFEVHVALWNGNPAQIGLDRRMLGHTGFLHLGRLDPVAARN
ncbi:MAG: hypothetical protein HY319_00625 [Armatimonadetes bacterium]|nr:hypothetical protein [Armatimonadota bacterium]